MTAQGENTGTGGERFELHLWEEAFHFIENEIGLIGIPQVTSMETAHLQRGSGRESHITDIEAAALPQQGKKMCIRDRLRGELSASEGLN